MSQSTDALLSAIGAALHAARDGQNDANAGTVSALTRLSGGANMETWSLDYATSGKQQALILRRRPAGVVNHPVLPAALSLQAEGELIALARRAGVAVPTVIAGTAPASDLGETLLMTRLSGEALPQRILRDERYTGARERLAFQCGETLANIHSVALEELPAELRDLDWHADLQRLQELLDVFGNPSPALAMALRFLCELPPPETPRVLCHGDFRLGNLLINDSGLAAVLDWELAHVGFAGEDLGYLCANVWRFSQTKPVGGFGEYRELLAGYRSVRDSAPDMRELFLWQLYAALGWGLVCLTMLELHNSGADASMERAAIGRRLSESEIDCLLLMESIAAGRFE